MTSFMETVFGIGALEDTILTLLAGCLTKVEGFAFIYSSSAHENKILLIRPP